MKVYDIYVGKCRVATACSVEKLEAFKEEHYLLNLTFKERKLSVLAKLLCFWRLM